MCLAICIFILFPTASASENKVTFYLECCCGFQLAGNKRLQETLNIIGPEFGHRLLLQEIFDEVGCFAERTHGRVTKETEAKLLCTT